MDENNLTVAPAPDPAPADEADNVSVQTTASEQESREERIAAAVARRDEGKETPAANEPEAPAPEDDKTARKGVPKLPDWAQKKLDEMAFAQREAAREARRLKEENDRLRVRPVQASQDDVNQALQQAPEQDGRFGGYRSQAEFDQAVEVAADRRLAAQRIEEARVRFDQECNNVYAKGTEEFTDFPDAVKTLQTLGAMTPGMLEAAFTTDAPHQVLYKLGSDPDRAQRIMALPPAKMIAELTKLSLAQPVAPTKAVSRAPAPVRPVEGSARTSSEPRDDDDDAAWFAKRREQKAARHR